MAGRGQKTRRGFPGRGTGLRQKYRPVYCCGSDGLGTIDAGQYLEPVPRPAEASLDHAQRQLGAPGAPLSLILIETGKSARMVRLPGDGDRRRTRTALRCCVGWRRREGVRMPANATAWTDRIGLER
jgi:hypothetical protein